MTQRWGLAALAAAWLAGACAHVEAPSGGPEDKLPPAVLVTRPDTLAVVRGWNAPAVIVFNERVSERGISDAVDVSPRTSMVVAEHRGDEIRVRLRDGWQPNQIYHVRVRPPVQDLFGNPIREPVELVFSTGPAIPETRASGVVRDPITGKPELDVRVEAIRVADSLVYAVGTDSAGVYRFRRVPEGEYLLRAFRDMNRNRALDEYEPRDTARVTLAAGDTVSQRLGILLPDSTPPQLAEVEARDSILELRFDDYLAPDQDLPPARIQIVSADGRFVPVSQLTVGALPGANAALGGPAAPARPRAPATPGAAGAADTADAGPLPSQTLVARLTGNARLAPSTEYRITIRGVRNVVGLTGDSELTFKTPEAPAAPDTTAPAPAAPDTVAPAQAAPAAPPDPAGAGARVGQLLSGKPELLSSWLRKPRSPVC